MKQTRLESLLEVCINIAIGWTVSMLITIYVVAPLWNLDWTVSDSFWVTAIYTVAAITRGYVVRRFFNASLHKLAHRIALKVLR